MPWLVYAFLSAITAALVAIFGKIGLQEINPTIATTVRAIFMSIVLALISASTIKQEWSLVTTWDAKHWVYIALSALAGSLSLLFYFIALKVGPASKVAAIDRLSLVFVIILSALFLGEQLTAKVAAGAVLIVTGTYLIMLG